MYEELEELIKSKDNDLDEQTLTYFTNYFYILVKDKLIPGNVKLDDLIDNAITFAGKIEFYDENHRIYLENGPDTKGFRDPETKTIYIRNNLEEPLREITVYHELHHAVQTNPQNGEVGINQESNIGRLIMEGQTQYFAEKVYSEIHNVNFVDKEINSEDLRMINNGIVVSNLHNYEMYDNLLSKLAIMLNVSKDYFVFINFLYSNNEGLNHLETKYNEAKEKYQLPYSFDKLMFILDYIYCVDLISYVDNLDKKTVLSGEETENTYEIHPNKNCKLSLQQQRKYINSFDVDNFLALTESAGDFREFSRYIIDNKKRDLVTQFIGTYDSQEENEGHNTK